MEASHSYPNIRTSHHNNNDENYYISLVPTSSPSIYNNNNIMTVPDHKPPEGDDETVTDTWVPTTDEIIIYTTSFVMILVLITCAMMYITKPKRSISRNGTPNPSADEMEQGLLQKDISSPPNSSIIDHVKKKKKKIIRKKKIKNDTNSQQGLDFDVENNSVIESEISGASSEASSLLENTRARTASSGFKVDPDLTLLTAFTSVLRQGITISLHTLKGVKQISLTLSGTELKWQSLKVFVRKICKLDIKDILYIEMGKKTTNFKLPGASSVLEDYCFSLITNQESIDLEASSKVERDALAQGFAILIARSRYIGSS